MPAATTKTVRLAGIAFSPMTPRISRGAKVKFSWQDSGRTRRTASDRTKGTVTTLAFKRAGTYDYVCTIHATADANGRFAAGQMVGRVVVR